MSDIDPKKAIVTINLQQDHRLLVLFNPGDQSFPEPSLSFVMQAPDPSQPATRASYPLKREVAMMLLQAISAAPGPIA
ncbi:MAG TPA: hypothetical protein VGM90_09830 [Kofleriaceae bacterium]|jgi:hypothetical protein